MIGLIRRALDRRRAIREMVDRLVDQLGVAAWKHARDRANAARSSEERAFWRRVQSRIEARDDRAARTSVARRSRV